MISGFPAGGPQAFAPIAEAGGRFYLGAIGAARSENRAVSAREQTEQIVDTARDLLATRELSLADVRKLTVALLDRSVHAEAMEVLAARFAQALPAMTVFVANGLPDPEWLLHIDFEAEVRTNGAVPPGEEIFLSAAFGAESTGRRSLEEASSQARAAMARLATALSSRGASVDDICKITVFLPERTYREAGYPEIGRLLGEIHPVSTGLIVPGLANVDTLFQMDVAAVASTPTGHLRTRKYKTSTSRYGSEAQQLDCGFCMSVRAGRRVFLRGQTGMDLDHVMRGRGDAVAQAEQAMRNVEVLLADVGCTAADVVKATLFVVDRAYLDACTEVIARHVGNVGATFSAVVVKGLASADLLMEVDVTAFAPA